MKELCLNDIWWKLKKKITGPLKCDSLSISSLNPDNYQVSSSDRRVTAAALKHMKATEMYSTRDLQNNSR